MDELQKLLSNGMIQGGGGVGIVIGAILWMRRFLSSDRAERAQDGANVDAIERYKALLDSERTARMAAEERADRFAKERNEAFELVGGLRTEIERLKLQVEYQGKEISKLVALTEGKSK